MPSNIPIPDVVERREKRFPQCRCFEDLVYREARDNSIAGMAKECVTFILKKMDEYHVCKKAGAYAAGQMLAGLAQEMVADRKQPANKYDVDALTRHFLAVSMELDEIAEHARDLVETGARKFKDEAIKKKDK